MRETSFLQVFKYSIRARAKEFSKFSEKMAKHGSE